MLEAVTVSELIEIIKNPVPAWKGHISASSHFYSGRSPSRPLFLPTTLGRAHTGIDMGAPEGSTIVAPFDCVIWIIGYNSGAGNYVTTRTKFGDRYLFTRHLHCLRRFPVKVGDTVKAGTPIGYVSDTGGSTKGAYHDHFEVLWDKPYATWNEGLHLDPELLLLGSSPGYEWLTKGTNEMLEKGDRGENVRHCQTRLSDLGYDPGPADGIYGSKTADAVRRWQLDSGFTPTGALTGFDFAFLFPGAGGGGSPSELIVERTEVVTGVRFA